MKLLAKGSQLAKDGELYPMVHHTGNGFTRLDHGVFRLQLSSMLVWFHAVKNLPLRTTTNGLSCVLLLTKNLLCPGEQTGG